MLAIRSDGASLLRFAERTIAGGGTTRPGGDEGFFIYNIIC